MKTALILALVAAGPQAPVTLPTAEVLTPEPLLASSCTVTCQTAPSLSCTSEVGDCQTGWVGGTEWIGCDGDQLECVE